MKKIQDRITEFISSTGDSISAVERKIGASKGVLSRSLSNGSDFSTKWLVSLVENYPSLSAEWLMRGTGPMLLNDGAAIATDHSIAVHTNEGSITQTNQLPVTSSDQNQQPVPTTNPDCEHCSKLAYAKMEVEHLKNLVEAKNETISVLKDCLNRD